MAASLQTANCHGHTDSLKEVTVTGNPLGAADLIAPAASYTGAGLLLRSKTTLGETLDGTPGVSSTYFGPNASRLIIRGLWKGAPNWQLTTNLASTERAPKDYKLFAQGPHVATRAWETGDVALAK